MKNSAGRGGCYLPRPKAEVDNIHRAHKNNTISFPVFIGQQFNNLQRAALLTSLIQYDGASFQIW